MRRRAVDGDKTFGEVITGVDLAAPLDASTWSSIEACLHERGILIFKDQGHLTIPEEMAFAARWGHMEDHGAIPVLPITNVNKKGETLVANTNAYYNLQGNEGWHIDNTYQPRSAKAGILRAAVVPPGGTQTAFCDGWAAYDALDEATRSRISGLAAYHSGLYSQVFLLKMMDFLPIFYPK